MYEAIDDLVRMARGAGLDEARLRFELRDWAHAGLRDHGCTMSIDAIDSILNKDYELNAAGLAVWLKRCNT